jgi:hypothetical protein
MMLQACIGVHVDGLNGVVSVREPRLPIGIDHLRVEGLRVGSDRLNLLFDRDGRRVAVRAEGASRTKLRVRH